MDITTSQTIGPFSHEAWRWACEATAGVDSDAPTVTISGIIRDGNGLPINDAMIEAWLPAAAAATAEARHALPGFRRVASGEDGGYTLVLSRPAAQAADCLAGSPAALITVFARGLVKHQFTAVFLADDAGMADSPLVRQVPAERRATLVAQRNNSGDGYHWDIAMQGADETVFFDYV